MKRIARVVSVMLAFIMLASVSLVLGGCKSAKKQPKPEFISEDVPWFSSTKMELNVPYDESEFEFMNFSEPVYMNGYIYTIFQGYKIFDVNEAQNSDFDYESTTIKSILQYDLDGNLVSEKPVSNEEYRVGYCSNLEVYDNKLKITCDAYDKEEACYLTTQLLIDPETNVIEKSVLDIEIGPFETIEGEYQVGDKKVYLVADYDAMSFRFIISGEKPKSVYVNTVIEGLTYIANCIVIDDDTILGFGFGKESQNFELKLSSGEIRKSDVQIDWTMYSFVPVQDGKAYAANSEGIFTINDEFEIENVLDYDNTLVNLYDLNYATPLYVDDDLIVVASFIVSSGGMKNNVYSFRRADTNPNAGKKIIDVFSPIPYVSYAEAEAILKFNQTNKDYFATLRFSEDIASSDDDIENGKVNAEISNQIMIDILSGDGPDIVLNGFDRSEFNNPEYFIDLNQLIAEDTGFDKDKYFNNIIDASKNDDGTLYQIPATFGVTCIAAKVSDVGNDHIGFTYDSYEKFLDEVCNGISPINSSKNEYLGFCTSSGYFDYLKDGKVDFNSEEFKKACEFANTHFQENMGLSEHTIVLGSGSGCLNEPARFDLFDPGSIMRELGGTPETVGFYGFPSNEEHGPTAVVVASAAISVLADDSKKSACWDLIKIMLDDEVQINVDDSLPINKTALSNVLISMADVADKEYDIYVRMGYSEMQIVERDVNKVNRDIIDSFYEAVENITNVSRSDSSLSIIIVEEMPAYYVGQKDIDSVISIINDRAQTIYDERK